jgi:hypothetical protein
VTPPSDGIGRYSTQLEMIIYDLEIGPGALGTTEGLIKEWSLLNRIVPESDTEF